MKRYLFNLAVLFDIAINTIILGGSPYETISSRVQKRVEKGDAWAVKYASPLICWIFNDPQHCVNSRIPDSIIHNSPNWWRNLP